MRVIRQLGESLAFNGLINFLIPTAPRPPVCLFVSSMVVKTPRQSTGGDGEEEEDEEDSSDSSASGEGSSSEGEEGGEGVEGETPERRWAGRRTQEVGVCMCRLRAGGGGMWVQPILCTHVSSVISLLCL